MLPDGGSLNLQLIITGRSRQPSTWRSGAHREVGRDTAWFRRPAPLSTAAIHAEIFGSSGMAAPPVSIMMMGKSEDSNTIG